jgi:lipopolysaccharide transport system ATP-binding protein
MYVRLAFAVAAHLEPEILIVDEVLAVGDAEFQKKCLGKMKDVSGQGRTVIFVSHNMLAIKSLCSIGMYLSSGKILQSGKINEVIERYLEEERSISRVSLIDRSDRVGNGVIKFDEVTFYNREGMEVSEVPSGDDLTIKLKYKSILPGVNNAEVAIAFNNNLGIQIAMISNTVLDKTNKELGESGYFVFKIPNIPFVSGTYSMNLFCRVNNEITDWIVNTAALSITVGDYYKTGKNSDKEQSIFLLNFDYDSES